MGPDGQTINLNGNPSPVTMLITGNLSWRGSWSLGMNRNFPSSLFLLQRQKLHSSINLPKALPRGVSPHLGPGRPTLTHHPFHGVYVPSGGKGREERMLYVSFAKKKAIKGKGLEDPKLKCGHFQENRLW